MSQKHLKSSLKSNFKNKLTTLRNDSLIEKPEYDIKSNFKNKLVPHIKIQDNKEKVMIPESKEKVFEVLEYYQKDLSEFSQSIEKRVLDIKTRIKENPSLDEEKLLKSNIESLNSLSMKVWNFSKIIKGALEKLKEGNEAFLKWYNSENDKNFSDLMGSEDLRILKGAHAVNDALFIVKQALDGKTRQTFVLRRNPPSFKKVNRISRKGDKFYILKVELLDALGNKMNTYKIVNSKIEKLSISDPNFLGEYISSPEDSWVIENDLYRITNWDRLLTNNVNLIKGNEIISEMNQKNKFCAFLISNEPEILKEYKYR